MRRPQAYEHDRDYRSAVLAYVSGRPDHPLKLRALARALSVPDGDYTAFRGVVRELIDDGLLILGAGRTVRAASQAGLELGTFRAHPRGFGFVLRPGQPDLFIHRRYVKGARDGDTVVVRPLRLQPFFLGPRAEIVRVLERAPVRWVGILTHGAGGWVVHPQGGRRLPTVDVVDGHGGGAQAGELVVVQPLGDATGEVVAGEVVSRLGHPNDAHVRILGVIRQYGLADAFSDETRAAAEAAAGAFDPEDLHGREDLRALLTVTIDPADARDFDDALSLTELPGGHVELGVHIADVAHFVPQDGPVDLEARRRGLSVYFPGQVLPMLPEVLSSDLCSLVPGQTRYTKSVFIQYDGEGCVRSARIAATAIRSHARLTYCEAQGLIDGDGEGLPHLATLLKRAADLAVRIRHRRRSAGMLTLDLPELEIDVADDGRVADVRPAERHFAHTLIEMFMVEANEAVAQQLDQARLPHLQRVHPDPETRAARGLVGLKPLLGRAVPRALTRETARDLLKAAEGRPGAAAAHMVLLRALAQAYYAPGRGGHFALASSSYCHFTSPIRRYPDLTVHRAVDVLLAGARGRRRGRAARGLGEGELEELGRRCSMAERRALEAGRDVNRQLLLLYMRRCIGQVAEGVVTGVLPLGVFVRLSGTLADGVIRVGDFGPDRWEYDRETTTFRGVRSGRLVHLGLVVNVRIAAIDEVRQELVLVPADDEALGAVRAPRREERGKRTRGRRKGDQR